MAVNLDPPRAEQLLSISGVRLGIAKAHVRKADRKDLLLIELAEGSRVGGVFTRNRFSAAPVQVCREHLAAEFAIRALVVNTGNANAGTGEDGPGRRARDLRRGRAACSACSRSRCCRFPPA